jgi:hypothetical protein
MQIRKKTDKKGIQNNLLAVKARHKRGGSVHEEKNPDENFLNSNVEKLPMASDLLKNNLNEKTSIAEVGIFTLSEKGQVPQFEREKNSLKPI